MKDRSNKEKPVLGPTVSALGSMSRSLAALHEEVYSKSPAWFAVMAPGYIKHLRDLLDDIEWLMEDMVPQELREQAAQAAPETEPEVIAMQDAA